MVKLSFRDAGLLLAIADEWQKTSGCPRVPEIISIGKDELNLSTTVVYRAMGVLSDKNLIRLQNNGSKRERRVSAVNKVAIKLYRKFKLHFKTIKRQFPSLPNSQQRALAVQIAGAEVGLPISEVPVDYNPLSAA